MKFSRNSAKQDSGGGGVSSQRLVGLF
ncbi:MAG TPA: hypothetical protein DIU10_08060 [Sulfitobacter sp.]|nr:hypothetical protein [Sulfitobacter sp.]